MQIICDGCNNPDKNRIVKIECQDCKQKLALCIVCESEEYCPSCVAISSQFINENKIKKIRNLRTRKILEIKTNSNIELCMCFDL